MKFTHYERIILSNLLPAIIPERNSRFIYKLLDEFASELSLSSEDIEYLGLKVGGEMFTGEDGVETEVPQDSIKWNPTKTLEKDICIPPVVVTILSHNLQELDGKGLLPREAISVFDKFVGESEWFKEKEREDI